MPYFKVHFKNNKPIAAEKILYMPVATDLVNITDDSGKRIIEWLVVSADDEHNALEEAEILMKLYILPFS